MFATPSLYPMIKNILLLDDDELFREGLRRLIDSSTNFRIVKSINLKTFIKNYNQGEVFKNCDLIIATPPNNETDAIALCEDYLAHTTIPLMIFTNLCTKSLVMKTIEIGGCAFFTKNISPDELQTILVDISASKNASDIKLHPVAREVLMTEDRERTNFTRAEEEVLRLVCEQKSSVEISADLGISIRTVESRKRNMMRKSQSKNMIGVVMQYIQTERVVN